MKTREALAALGYQERAAGVWLKPVGWHCFAFSEKRQEWCNWFVDGTGKIACWNSAVLDPAADALFELKDLETFTRKDVAASRCVSHFELASFYLEG
jgi:hypothetical protein